MCVLPEVYTRYSDRLSSLPKATTTTAGISNIRDINRQNNTVGQAQSSGNNNYECNNYESCCDLSDHKSKVLRVVGRVNLMEFGKRPQEVKESTMGIKSAFFGINYKCKAF